MVEPSAPAEGAPTSGEVQSGAASTVEPSAPAEDARTSGEVQSGAASTVEPSAPAEGAPTSGELQSGAASTVEPSAPEAATLSEPEQTVLDYCAAVRGVLNDDQGGPLHPPGVRMAEALGEIRDSIGRARAEKKGGAAIAL
jgi:hypothetical protein